VIPWGTRATTAEGEHRQQLFDELRALLAAHETAEEMVVRPATRKAAGDDVADARNHEEDEANRMLAELEKLDVESAEFTRKFAAFEKAVVAHAEREEAEEFPQLRRACSKEDRVTMARALVAAERIAPHAPASEHGRLDDGPVGGGPVRLACRPRAGRGEVGDARLRR
jgi:hemerythrin superfamily protein